MKGNYEEFIKSLNSTSATITQEQFIEHEIEIRVIQKTTDERFLRLESKMNWIISLVVGGLIMPIALHFSRLVS
jgi:hypothetical protein